MHSADYWDEQAELLTKAQRQRLVGRRCFVKVLFKSPKFGKLVRARINAIDAFSSGRLALSLETYQHKCLFRKFSQLILTRSNDPLIIEMSMARLLAYCRIKKS